MSSNSSSTSSVNGGDRLRRGPWSKEEDELLRRYIYHHGDGRWNSLAKRAGLRRTGKSCRLRWLNYLNPEVKRGNLTPQEQLLILQLHSKWGNRWSKIARYLPGRTDNEIKNYWRTRVQKEARNLNMDPNGAVFDNVVKCFFMPRLVEKIERSSSPIPPPPSSAATCDRSPQSVSGSSADCVPLSGDVNSLLPPPPGIQSGGGGGCYDLDAMVMMMGQGAGGDVDGGFHVAEGDWIGNGVDDYEMWNIMDELFDC